jgi:hypothetical protein
VEFSLCERVAGCYQRVRVHGGRCHNRDGTFGTTFSKEGTLQHYEVPWREPDDGRDHSIARRSLAGEYWRSDQAKMESSLYESAARCHQRGRVHGGQEYVWPYVIGTEDGSVMTAQGPLGSRAESRSVMDAKEGPSVPRVGVQKANCARKRCGRGRFFNSRGVGKKGKVRGSIPEPPPVRTRAECQSKMLWVSTDEPCNEIYNYTHRRSVYKQRGAGKRAVGGTWLWSTNLVCRTRDHKMAQMEGPGGRGARERCLEPGVRSECTPREGEVCFSSVPRGRVVRAGDFSWGGVGLRCGLHARERERRKSFQFTEQQRGKESLADFAVL